MKNLQMKNKGITLVALVITIIILLILAGITITQLTGSGLFENAKLAEEKSKNAQEKEEGVLADYENKIGQYIDGSNRDDEVYDKNVYDVWPTWLSLAGIENAKQYSGQKILLNESIMEKVMNNQEALQYMLNSIEFILPRVLESETATAKLYESSKLVTIPKLSANTDQIITGGFKGSGGVVEKTYTAFDQDNLTHVGTSEMTNTAAIGCYIGYDFGKAVNILKVEGKIRMKSYKIQYSDDKENWADCIENTSAGSDNGDNFSDLILENVGAHRYWRLYVNGGQNYSSWGAVVYELQFYGF